MMPRLFIALLVLAAGIARGASLIGPLTLGTNTLTGGSLAVNNTNVTGLTNGPMLTFEISGGIATPVFGTNMIALDRLVYLPEGTLLGNNDGLGDGPAVPITPLNTANIQFDVAAGFLTATFTTNDIPLLSRGTNEFAGLLRAGSIYTTSFAADSLTVGTLTATNYQSAITTLAPTSGGTNFTIDFSAGGAQLILATNDVHLLNFPNMPASGFVKWVNLTILPSGGNRTVTVRDGASTTNIRTVPLLVSPYVVTNAIELVIRGMVNPSVTNIAVFAGNLFP